MKTTGCGGRRGGRLRERVARRANCAESCAAHHHHHHVLHRPEEPVVRGVGCHFPLSRAAPPRLAEGGPHEHAEGEAHRQLERPEQERCRAEAVGIDRERVVDRGAERRRHRGALGRKRRVRALGAAELCEGRRQADEGAAAEAHDREHDEGASHEIRVGRLDGEDAAEDRGGLEDAEERVNRRQHAELRHHHRGRAQEEEQAEPEERKFCAPHRGLGRLLDELELRLGALEEVALLDG